jgi:hypothetical protein
VILTRRPVAIRACCSVERARVEGVGAERPDVTDGDQAATWVHPISLVASNFWEAKD